MALTLRENICKARRLPINEEVLRGRAELLALADRELIEAILIRGQTVASVARIAGLSRRVLSERVKRLARRLASRKFLDAARAIGFLPREEAVIARLRFCEGLSERKLAKRLGVTMYTIRRQIDRISAQVALIRRMRQVERKGGAGLDWNGQFVLGSRQQAALRAPAAAKKKRRCLRRHTVKVDSSQSRAASRPGRAASPKGPASCGPVDMSADWSREPTEGAIDAQEQILPEKDKTNLI